MSERFIPHIRSFFIAPANRPDLVRKFLRFKADCYIIDLEDGTPPLAKEDARSNLSELVEELRNKNFNSQLGVRVNEPWSLHYLLDLRVAWDADIDFVVIPKLEAAEQLFPALHGLRLVGKPSRPRRWIMGGIESVQGVAEVHRLVTAAPELASVYFGGEDFATDLGAVRTREAREVHYARSRVVLHAKKAGLNAIDQGIPDFKDDEWFRADAREGKLLGYDGKICLLPRQVEIAHSIFSPDDAEVERARRLVAAYEEAMEKGIGTLDFEGQMVDGPLYKRAKRIISSAKGE